MNTSMSMPSSLHAAWRHSRPLLPVGAGLPASVFERRHLLLRIVLVIHLPALAVFGVARRYDPVHLVADLVPIALALFAERIRRTQSWRAFWVTVGLAWCSTTLVHLSGGQVEAHFHFFIVVGLIALYQRWTPFAWAIGFTVVSHGVGSALWPGSMFNHTAAINRPWLWAGIHGVAVLAAAVAQIVFWGAAEREQARIGELSGRLEKVAARNAEQRARFESLVANAFDGIAIVDAAGVVTWASPAMTRLAGAETGDQFPRSLDVDDRARFVQALYRSESAESVEALVVRTSGDDVQWLELAIVDLSYEEAVGGIVVNARDVTEQRIAEEELARRATHDSLTGLANRARFGQLLTAAVEAASEDDVTVMFFDLDGFKSINDTHGHAAGDALLCSIAGALRSAVRPADTVARLGGDEFVVLCPGLGSPEAASELATRLADAAGADLDFDGRRISTTVSVGVAIRRSGDTADDLLRAADIAMYAAKHRGRDRVELFDPARHGLGCSEEVVAQLRRAIDGGELVVHYQPIISIRSGDVVGLEALVRWAHPTDGLVPPSDFIPLAEEHGLIHDLGAVVLRTACADILDWDRDGVTYVSVNVSSRQLQRRSFAGTVSRVLAESGLPASRLILEITESVIVDDDQVITDNIDQLTEAGIRLAMDDFGTGHSALVNLKRFDFGLVKVDREFVAGLGTRSDDEAIVRAVVGMAHALGMQVVAEGIEEPDQLTTLAALGSDCAQGYALGRPVPLTDLVARNALHETPRDATSAGSGAPSGAPT